LRCKGHPGTELLQVRKEEVLKFERKQRKKGYGTFGYLFEVLTYKSNKRV
jgi:hypothetical protein